jgi:hypothetical protein
MPSYMLLDDYSPLIKYRGEWSDSYNLTLDPATPLYNELSFHSSQENGATVSGD